MNYVLLSLALILPMSAGSSATYVVAPDGTGDFPTIRTAINASSDGDSVALADGTFTGGGNYDLSFDGKAITVLSLSGQPEQCVIDCQGVGRGFIFDNEEGPTSILKGITIANGRNINGGGIYCHIGTSPMLTDCIITGGTSGGYGAGIACYDASPSILNCEISYNHNGTPTSSDEQGGGLHCRDASSPLVSNCIFRGNSTQGTGAGVYCDYDSAPTFTDCVFEFNSAVGDGGGLFAFGGSFVTLTRCSFSGNSAARGGAVAGDGPGDPDSLAISESLLLGNNALEAGGGLFLSGLKTVRIVATTIAGNLTYGFGGGIALNTCPLVEVAGCQVTGNFAYGPGGGIHALNYASIALDETTVASNASAQEGGALFLSDSNVEMARTIVWGNCEDHTEVFTFSSSSSVTVLCSAIDASGFSGLGQLDFAADNIPSDPLFCGPLDCASAPSSDGNFSLGADSPCLPQNNSCGQQIGALGEACGVVSAVSHPQQSLSRLRLVATPNPFTESTRLAYSQADESGRLEIFDIGGRAVLTRTVQRGERSLIWSAVDEDRRTLPAGVYFARLEIGKEKATRRLVLAR